MTHPKQHLSPNNFLIYFYAIPIGILVLIGLLEAASYDRTEPWADLGNGIFLLGLGVFGLGSVSIVGLIYSIRYLVHVKEKHRRWQYRAAIIVPIVAVMWAVLGGVLVVVRDASV